MLTIVAGLRRASSMVYNLSLCGLLALVGGLMVASSVPASAEFFGCNDRPGQLLYSYTGTPDAYIRNQHRYRTPRDHSHHYSSSSRSRHWRQATYYGDLRYWNGR
jgi:hypothetical protein